MKHLQDRLLGHLQRLAIERNPYYSSGGHLFTQEYIRSHLSRYGTLNIHEFTVNNLKHKNFILPIGALPSRSRSRPPIVIGAHYDAVPGTLGADDNATGVAVLLELARHFSENPIHYPLQLVAFDMEEYGLLGSTSYANYLKDQKQALRLMISLEMLGYCDPTPHSQHYPPILQHFYPNTGDFIAMIGNVPTIPDLLHLQTYMQKRVPCEWLPAVWRGWIVPSTRLSDHAPFWDAGYKAIMITDTAFLRNPHYHKSSDRIETLDLEFLSSVYQGLLEGLQAMP